MKKIYYILGLALTTVLLLSSCSDSDDDRTYVTSVKLNTNAISLEIGETQVLTATVNPQGATDKTVSWSSSDPGVAEVDNSGKVTALTNGETTITVTTNDGALKDECVVTVKEKVIDLTGVELDKNELFLYIGETDILTATVSPMNATDTQLSWSSSDPDVAEVDQNGEVTALTVGKTVISVTSNDGELKDECEVTVKVKVIDVTSVELNKNKISLSIGETGVLTATVNPQGATDKTISWSSSAPNVAEVDQDGNITAFNYGKATITVTTNDGELKDECEVTVLFDVLEAITDRTFKAYAQSRMSVDYGNNPKWDMDEDGKLSMEEAASVTHEINLNYGFQGTKVKSLTGIEYFTGVTSILCNNNNLTEFDVSKNPGLTRLECSNNKLQQIDLSKNINLVRLNIGDNNFNSLDLSKLTKLERLDLIRNKLTEIDLSNNKELSYLHCGYNQLTTLDIRNNPQLETLYCSNNQLSRIDVSKNPYLVYFYCGNNPLTELNVLGSTSLITLDCANGQLTDLDVSENTRLDELRCDGNRLKKLDFSTVTKTTRYFLSCGNQTTASGGQQELILFLRANQLSYWENNAAENSRNTHVKVELK